MKVANIVVNEATATNMRLLQDFAKAVFDYLPSTLTTTTMVRPERVFENRTIDMLYNKYPTLGYAVDQLLGVAVVFDMTFVSSTRGLFSTSGSLRNPVVTVYCQSILYHQAVKAGRGEEFELSKRVDISSNPEFFTTLVHELRHAVQFSQYPRYAGKDKSDTHDEYKRSPIEIDAAFHHMLDQNRPDQFTDAQAYATALITSLADYKTLSPHYKKHYYRKAAAYWTEVMRNKADKLDTPIGTRLDARRKALGDVLLALVDQAFDAPRVSGGDIDLRTLDGYSPDVGSFLVPTSWIQHARGTINRAAYNESDELSNDVRALLGLSLALGATGKVDKEIVNHTLKLFFDTDVNALADVWTKDTIHKRLQGFDTATIAKLIKRRLGMPKTKPKTKDKK